MNFTTSEENYLKTIFHLQANGGSVSTSTLAEKLNTKPSSVTDMMKKLNAKKLLHYKPYYGFSLSTEGKKAAIIIIRRHRLWEYFLFEKLKFDWEQVHSLAEELEHVKSRELIDRLDEFLGFPSVDPHGDPIPDSKGKIAHVKKIPLPLLPLKQKAEVVQVIYQVPELLELLKHKNINIKSKLMVVNKFEFDGSLEVSIEGRIENISESLAKNILVVYEHTNTR